MFSESQLSYLRGRLQTAGYHFDAVADALGEAGQSALLRNTTLAGQESLARVADNPDTAPLATLVRLFILQREVSWPEAEAALGEAARWPELAAENDGRIRALLDVRPYGSPDDGASGWLCADLAPGLDGRAPQVRPDYVLGASPASTTLAQLTVRRPVQRALDLGTGCGVQSLHLARHAREVVATDLNPRAVELARATFALNDVAVDVREGSLYEPVAGERFDLIVTNPPYVMSPPRGSGERLTYREGEFTADDLVHRVVTEGVDHLSDGGLLQVLANWVTTAEDPGRRVTGWLRDRDDVDVLVLERERLDRFAYIEMWLADAGLSGTPEWEPRYTEWLAYFDELSIESVSMGWIVVRRREPERRWVRSESWPYEIAQPVGPAIADDLDGVAWSRSLGDDELLARAWRLRDDVEEERTQVPGAADPTSIVFRRRTGLRRACLASSALAAILGASDGDLTWGQLIGAVAQLTDVDPASLEAEVLPQLRELLETGWFTPAS